LCSVVWCGVVGGSGSDVHVRVPRDFFATGRWARVTR
jgi:hypothetical protein